MSKFIQVTNIRHGNPGVSGWYAILEEPEPADVLEKDINADWLVIGGGLPGWRLQDVSFSSGKKSG